MKKSEFKQIIKEEIKNLKESYDFSASDIMGELQTWLTFNPKDKELISKSNINTRNNKDFKKLVKDWSNGVYDEDPEYAKQELMYIVSKSPIKEEVEDEPFEGEVEEGQFTEHDGWNKKALGEVGLLDWIQSVERIAYEIRNARRGSYGIDGDTDEDLIQTLKYVYDELNDVINRMDN
jgi:hypothetical protein